MQQGILSQSKFLNLMLNFKFPSKSQLSFSLSAAGDHRRDEDRGEDAVRRADGDPHRVPQPSEGPGKDDEGL